MKKKRFYCPYCGEVYCIQSVDCPASKENAFVDHRKKVCWGTRQEFNEKTGIFSGDIKDFKKRIKEKVARCKSNYTLTKVAYHLGVI